MMICSDSGQRSRPWAPTETHILTLLGSLIDLVEDRLDTLLDLSLVRCPGLEGSQVKRKQSSDQGGWNIAVDDSLCQSFGNGRLADTGFTDQDRVVLRPPTENADDPPNLVVTTDDWIVLAVRRKLRHVA